MQTQHLFAAFQGSFKASMLENYYIVNGNYVVYG